MEEPFLIKDMTSGYLDTPESFGAREADSSQEKSFAESEKATAAQETSATSPLPDGWHGVFQTLQPEPELQPADDFDELGLKRV
ncbi:hypothetical protein AK812_SmicGene4963 [Symbiodinium microadriaticum]|uniref:Uncharacterized protein n=1 Tax=Symbiodinium microadriaticum TaxID=2951 RepID=A0A1Q9EUW5_SYMMI|nr:hypothetical protein AK812_SmicGene4963 [Symbiodinium microadriaticum]